MIPRPPGSLYLIDRKQTAVSGCLAGAILWAMGWMAESKVYMEVPNDVAA